MKPDKKSFNGVAISDAIRKARIHSGLTQDEFAALTGYARRTVASWEQGEREPSIAVFLWILKECKLSVEDLFGDDVSETRPSSEDSLVMRYNALDKEGKDFVDTTIRHETQRCLQMRT